LWVGGIKDNSIRADKPANGGVVIPGIIVVKTGGKIPLGSPPNSLRSCGIFDLKGETMLPPWVRIILYDLMDCHPCEVGNKALAGGELKS
jgi:hypothetical protein